MTERDDTTPRKSTSQDIHEARETAERRLDHLQRLARIGDWEYDPSTDTLRWSAETCRLFALDPAHAPRTLDEFLQWVHPDDRDALRASIAAGETVRPDYRVPQPDGSIRHLHEEVEYEWDAGGRVLRSRGTVQDITERKELEQALRESEERYRIVAENTADWEFWFDPSGAMLYCSPACEAITGHSPEAFRRDPELFLRIIEAGDRPAMEHHLRESLQDTAHDAVQYRIRTVGGELRWIEHYCRPIHGKDGMFLGNRGSNRDVTARMLILENLRASEERNRQIVDHLNDAYYLHDTEGRILDCNENACRMLGYAREELVGAHLTLIDAPENARRISEHMDQLLRQGRAEWEGEHRRKDGTIVPVAISTRLIDREGSGLVQSMVRDISERKAMETNLQRNARMLDLVHQVQAQYIDEGEFDAAFQQLMRAALEITGSAYGFLDEVQRGADGRPFKRSLALTNIAWDEPSRKLYADLQSHRLEFHNLANLAGRPVVDGRMVISNDPANDPRAGGLPPGHPPLHAYMGLPLYYQGEVVGVLGVANREGGYGEDLPAQMEPLLSVCAVLINAQRERASARAAQKALAASEATYRSLFEGAQDAIFVADAETGMLVDANPRALALLGRSLEEVRTMQQADLHPPDTRTEVQRMFREALREPTAVLRSAEVLHRDGHRIPVEISSGGEVEVDGRRVHFGIFRDISQRLRDEETLRQSEERYRSIFEQGPLGMAVVGLDRRCVRVNDRFCRMLGYSEEELIGRSFLDITHPDCREADLENTIRLMRGEIPLYQVEKRYLGNEGRTVHGKATAAMLRDAQGNPLAFHVLIEDITERERAREALARSEAMYHDLVETSQDLIWRVDAEGRYTYLNQAWEKVLGYRPEEMVGRPFTDFQDPENAARDLQILKELLETGTIRGHETIHRHKDGHPVSLVFNAKRIVGPGGEVLGTQGSAYDITERKQVENAFRESEERWRAIVENEPECVKLLDREGRLLEMNPAGLAMIQATLEQVRGQKAVGLVAEEDRPAFNAMVEDVFRGETRHLVFDMIGLEGRRLTLETISVPLRDPGAEGEVQALLGVTRDVTELKRSELRYRTILGTAMDGFWLADGEGHLLEVNETYCRMSGFSREELLDKRISDLDAVEAPEETAAHIRQTIEAGQARFESRHRRKDGTLFDVEISTQYSPIEGGRFIVFIRDITDRRLAERTLQENEKRFTQVAEAAREWIWEVDAEGLYRYCSPAVEPILGYTPDEVVGQLHCYELFSPEVREELEAAAKETFRRRESFQGFVNPNRHKNGSTVILETSGFPMLGADGSLLGYRGVDIDISERINAERTIRRSLEEKEILLKEIHHRVKNNLQVVASLLDLQSGTLKEPESLRVFQESRNRIRVMAMVHEKLYRSLDLARIPLPEYLRGLAEYLAGIYGLPGLPVELRCAVEEVGVGIDDAIACGLIVNELVSNAYKYAFRDRGPEASPPEVRLGVRPLAGGEVELSVADNGTGLPAGLEVARTATMGLQLVDLLVRQLRGTLEVDREGGAAFRVRFRPAGEEGGRLPDGPGPSVEGGGE